jgi:hypothetical protein
MASDGTVADAMLLTRPLPATKAAISRSGLSAFVPRGS